MRPRRLFWHFFPAFLGVVIGSLILTVFYTARVFRASYFSQVAIDLESSAQLIEPVVAQRLSSGQDEAIDSLCKKLSQHAETRLTIVAPSGRVLGDSDEDPAVMENHADRPEIRKAMGGEIGVSRRFSVTLDKHMMYVAIPYPHAGPPEAVIRTAKPLWLLEQKFSDVLVKILVGLGVMMLVSGYVSYAFSRRVTRPIEELKSWADRLANGDFQSKLPLSGAAEIAGLTEALNTMGEQLSERIRTITQQRNEQRAILESMLEGVIAVDVDEHVININPSAAAMLNVKEEETRDRWIQEAIRNSDIQAFVRQTLTTKGPCEAEIMLYTPENEERFLQSHGSVLNDQNGECIGALVVLNDVTRLKRLERIRQDFVANVSHELRTPLTSIKGSIETVQTAALGDRKQTERFLSIALNHVNRLNVLVDDLLTLSRIEKEAEVQEITLERGRIREVVSAAVGIVEQKAAPKNITITTECSHELVAEINPMLLEQALTNLLDNAIKYSEDGKPVRVDVAVADGSIGISVEDQGPGIPQGHITRLFERFYRVDKARSRKMGGTGLGLAIVKHIALAHRGDVSVDSKVGRGSRFTIWIPAFES